MKALVVSCHKDVWYSDRVGQVFDVEVNQDEERLLRVKDSTLNLYKPDCHIIESLATVLLKWEKEGGQLQEWMDKFSRDGYCMWVNVDSRLLDMNKIFRIKPEEKLEYRAYTFEEAKEVFTKDGFGVWVKSTDTGAVGLVCYVSDTGVSIPGIGGFLYERFLQYCTHLDGSPCGVKIN